MLLGLVSSVVSAFSHRASAEQVRPVQCLAQTAAILGGLIPEPELRGEGADIANMCLLHTLHSDNIEWP